MNALKIKAIGGNQYEAATDLMGKKIIEFVKNENGYDFYKNPADSSKMIGIPESYLSWYLESEIPFNEIIKIQQEKRNDKMHLQTLRTQVGIEDGKP